MAGKRMALVWACAAAVMCTGLALAVDCAVCTECSADPAFVQRDARGPELLPILRRYASQGIRGEGLASILMLS
jgi:hypothetical protein